MGSCHAHDGAVPVTLPPNNPAAASADAKAAEVAVGMNLEFVWENSEICLPISRDHPL